MFFVYIHMYVCSTGVERIFRLFGHIDDIQMP